MQLKQQDVKTFESYKKAMRVEAARIKPGTKFCLYNEVQLPDAAGKMHTVKPFLVVGSAQAMFKPLLPLLKGGRKFLCEGTCLIHEGKVILDSPKVPFSQIRSQASFFKDLFGKPVGISDKTKDVDEEETEEKVQASAGQIPTLRAGAPPLPPKPGAPPAASLKTGALPPPLPGAGGPNRPAPNLAASLKPPAPPLPPKPAGPGTTTPPAAPPAAEPHPVRLAKASLAWHGTRSIVDGKCNELKHAIRAHYGKSHPEVIKQIEANMHKIDAITSRLDHKLADSFKKASAAPTDAARAAELRNSRAILNEYISYVKAEPLIAHIDKNPFGVQCNLRQVLAASLTHMSLTMTA